MSNDTKSTKLKSIKSNASKINMKVVNTEVVHTADIPDGAIEGRRGKGRPRKFTNAEELYQVGLKYIEDRQEEHKPITVTGLCIALDTTKDILNDYESGKYNDSQNDFTYPIKRLKMMVEEAYEEKLHGTTAAGAIFALKNFGWRDVMDVNTNKQPEELTNDDIAELIRSRQGQLRRCER